MKKAFPILLAAALVAVSCQSKDYRAELEGKIQDFSAFVTSMENNTDLTIDQVEHKVDSAYEIFQEEVLRLADEAVEKHKDDTVAVQAIQLLHEYRITDDEGLRKFLDKLGEEMKATPAIREIQDLLDKYSETEVGKPFKDFAVVQPDGTTKKLSDFAGNGKLCLVDFWASWCAPCRAEIPNVKEVYEKYGAKGLEVVSVAVWDNPEDSKKTADELGVVWNQILNAGADITQIYMIEGIPHIMLIGPDGTILARDLRGEEIEKAVKENL